MPRAFFWTLISHIACVKRCNLAVRLTPPLYKKAGEKAKGGIALTVSLIFKIAAVGILVSVLCQVLKHSGRDEHAFLISLAGLVLVLLWIVPYIYELFETIRQLFAL